MSTSTAKRVYVKVYETSAGLMVAACDEELLGAVIEDLERGIKVHILPSFYKGELVAPDELSKYLETADIGNLVGEETVKVALSSGLVHPSAVLRIRGVPIAYFVRV